jgi:hypothetical protein
VEARLAPALAASGTSAIERLLTAIVHELESNPLVRRLLTHPQEMAAVAARVRHEDLAAKADALLPLRAFVAAAQADGRLLEADPDVVVGVLRAATLLTLHRQDLGEAIYPAVMELLIASLARGLGREPTPADPPARRPDRAPR